MENKDNLAIPPHAILKIVLTSFLGAHVEDVMDENGDMERCVCIPLDRNGLRQGSTGKVSAYMFLNRTRNANQMGWSHYIKLKANPNFVKKMNDLGFTMPYLGNAKPSNFVIFKKNYEAQIKGEKVKVEDYD